MGVSAVQWHLVSDGVGHTDGDVVKAADTLTSIAQSANCKRKAASIRAARNTYRAGLARDIYASSAP